MLIACQCDPPAGGEAIFCDCGNESVRTDARANVRLLRVQNAYLMTQPTSNAEGLHYL